MPSLFVGIDVSQATLDVCILPPDRAFRVDNTPAGHATLIDTLRGLAADPAEVRAVLESTGGLELPVALALQAAGFPVAPIKPERARHFAKAHGQLAKTDAIDARILARFAQAIDLPVHPLPAEDVRLLRDLLDRRGQLVAMRTMETNHVSSTGDPKALASLKKHIAWLDREIGRIESDIDRRVAANPQWQEIDRILQSIPGVGPQTSHTLLGQLPELGRVDRKVIGLLVGLAPLANDTGGKEGPRHIVGGRQQVRNVLYMAALVASRCNPVARALYVRLMQRGKSAKVALIAVAHKLLTIANAMVRNRTEWRHSTVANSA